MVKAKVTLLRIMKIQRGGRGIVLPYTSSAFERDWWSAPRPNRFTPPERDPVPIVEEAGWVLRLVWTGMVNLSLRVRAPDRPGLPPTKLHYNNNNNNLFSLQQLG